MPQKSNVQDAVLNILRKNRIPCTIYLINGLPIKAKVLSFDSFTVYIQTSEGKENLIFKHAISSIVPARSLEPYLSFKKEVQKSNQEAQEQREEESGAS